MKKLVCYYAHPMLTYGSTIEIKDIALLEELGFEILNPNQKKHQIGCKEYAQKHGPDKVMDYFGELIKNECDLVAFRALPDGRLLSGVAYEVNYANDLNLPVIELPNSLKERSMDYPTTKAFLTQIGFYKY